MVGLLIHEAAKIYFEQEGVTEYVTLLEHLDCQLMKDFKIWEIYFLYRINKNFYQNICLNKNHFLCKQLE